MHTHRRSLRRAVRLLAACLAWLAFGATTPAAAQWRAGVAAVVITPEAPVRMAGYSSRVQPFTGTDRDLFAKALVLEDAAGSRVALVTTDLIGLRKDLVHEVVARLPAGLGLRDRAQVMLSASHTHAGPALSLDPAPGADVSAADAAATAAYTRRLVETLAALIGRATAALEPATLSWGGGVAHFAMNRREFTPKGIILGVNPRGPVDRSVPVLRVNGADGRPRVALFSYACHNTTMTGDNDRLSGDYAGFAQAEVERRVPGVQAMYMAGTGADANPYPRGTLTDARQHGEALGREVARVLASELREVMGPLRVAFTEAALPLQQPTRPELQRLEAASAGVHRATARQMLARLDRGEPLMDQYRAPVAVWQFGQGPTLVGLSGEVVVDYVHALEKALGPLQLWVVAYANDYFGYLPSPRVLEEGGYETRGLFSGDGWFAPEASSVLVREVRALAVQTGRSVPTDGVQLRAIGPDTARGASAAVVVEQGQLVHSALMFPVDAGGRLQGDGDARAQALQTLGNLELALRAADTSLDALVRVHVYVADASVTPVIDRLLAERFQGPVRPAVTVVESRMPRPGVLVAMDAVAATARRLPSGPPARHVVAGLPAASGGGAHVAIQPEGPFVIVSGRAAPGAFAAAVRATMEQLRADLEGIGLGFEHAVHVKTFLADMARADELQRIVASVFEGTAPPQVVTEWRGSSLPVEIELVATAPGASGGDARLSFVEPIASRFSRVARVFGGRPIFVSGLVGTSANPVTQVHEVFAELRRVLQEAGSDLRHLAKATYYVSDTGADQEINVIRPTLFDADRPPAASKISVQGTGRPGKGTAIDMIAVTTDR